jgi:hypothetical protein
VKKHVRDISIIVLILMRPPEADKMARQIEQLVLASWPESKISQCDRIAIIGLSSSL